MVEYNYKYSLAERLQDPAFRKEYEALESEFEAIRADIREQIATEEKTKIDKLSVHGVAVA